MGKALLQLKKGLRSLQTAWSIFGVTLGAILLTEAGFRCGFAVKDRIGATPQPDRRVLEEGYGGAAWPIAHYRELALLEERWEPYVYFRQMPFRGTTIAVGSDGQRATWKPPDGGSNGAARKRVKLLMLGGSSLWGFGARDDQTIPSLLARTLHERGWHIELKNLAEIGYVSTQELIALVRELQAGYRPDVVVFYDGVNDTTSAFLEGAAGLSTNEVNRRTEFNLLQSPARLAVALGGKLLKESGAYRFAQAVGRRFGAGAANATRQTSGETMRQLADAVAVRYSANLALAQALGRGFGFRPIFAWQPIVFTKRVLLPVEREEAARYAWTEHSFREVYGRIRASAELRTNPAFRDLSSLFDDDKNLVFIDYCHTTEAANQRIASALADGVIEALLRGQR